jgi:hypothetical protein
VVGKIRHQGTVVVHAVVPSSVFEGHGVSPENSRHLGTDPGAWLPNAGQRAPQIFISRRS